MIKASHVAKLSKLDKFSPMSQVNLILRKVNFGG